MPYFWDEMGVYGKGIQYLLSDMLFHFSPFKTMHILLVHQLHVAALWHLDVADPDSRQAPLFPDMISFAPTPWEIAVQDFDDGNFEAAEEKFKKLSTEI